MSKVTRAFLLGRSGGRLAATKAASKQAATPPDAQYTKLINGVRVNSVESYAPVSRVAISAKAGSRYETESNRGASHVLRIMTGSRTDDTTAVTLTRHLQQLGASLTCIVNRDLVCYRLNCLRDFTPEALQYLKECSLLPLFRQWELNDNAWRVRQDLELLKRAPEAMLVEKLYEAAFKSGLSNTLYCPEHMVGQHTTEMMNDYVKQHFTADNVMVTGLGIGHEDLVEFAGGLPAGRGPTAAAALPAFRGGEVRCHTGGKTAYAAVAMQREGLKDLKECLALWVLECILGKDQKVKYGKYLGSRLGAAAAAVSPDAPFKVCSINHYYQDTGIFGFAASMPSENAAQVLKALTGELKAIASGKLTAADLTSGKAKFMAEMFNMIGDEMLQEMNAHAFAFADTVNYQEAIVGTNALTLQDLTGVAKKVLGGKPCMAAVGDVSNVPYLDEL